MREKGGVVTLTITREFFEKIASGEKRVEYRRDCPYYRMIYMDRPRHLVLHVRRPGFLLCRLTRVRYIKRPKALERSIFITTPWCIAFEIEKAWGPLDRTQLADRLWREVDRQ